MKKIIPGRINSDQCEYCSLYSTDDGHDGCLGILPGRIRNACCGHGKASSAYLQYEYGPTHYKEDSNWYHTNGVEAREEQKILIKERDFELAKSVKYE